MNIQEFIKEKEEEFDDEFCYENDNNETIITYSFCQNPKLLRDKINNFLSQSILEYNEKIKEMIELEKVNSDYGVFVGEEKADIFYNQALDDIITNITQDTNPKE